jgi:DUF1707 SHOCT-like domain
VRQRAGEGRPDKDEFDLRLGQAFAARTYAELVSVTADLPAGLPQSRRRCLPRSRGSAD